MEKDFDQFELLRMLDINRTRPLWKLHAYNSALPDLSIPIPWSVILFFFAERKKKKLLHF